MKKKILILSMLFTLFILLGFSAMARDTEQQQHDMINIILKKPQKQWENELRKRPTLLNLNLLLVCEDRAKYAIVKNDYNQAVQIATLTDITATILGAKANYRLGLAFYFYRNKEYNLSLDICKNIANAQDKNATLKIVTGLNYFALGDYKKAKEEFSSAIDINPSSDEAHYQLGLCYKAQNNIQMALEEFQKAVNLNPGHIPAKTELEKAKNAENKNINNEEKTTNKNTKNAPLDPLQEAENYMNDNQTEKAKEILKNELMYNPNSFKANLLLGKIYAQSGNFEDALILLNKAKEIDSTSAMAFYYLGYTYEHIYETSKNKDDLKTSLESYEQSTKLDAEYSFALKDIKRIQKKIEEHKETPKNP